jgi:hypothetical protein
MKTIQLTQGQAVMVDDEDFDRLSQHKWFAQFAPDRTGGGAFVAVRDAYDHGRKRIYMHREILNAPRGITVDHIDRNPLNNQRSNLRLATGTQNSCNRAMTKSNTTGFKGVNFRKKHASYQAQIAYKGKKIHLGSFASVADAAAAYNKAAAELHGEFAYLNPIPEAK